MEGKWAAAIAMVAIVAVAGVSVMSTTGGDQTDGVLPDTGVETGQEATLSFATYDQTESSQTQVASNLYFWDNSGEDTVLLEKNSASDSRTTFDLETGDNYGIAAFDSTHPYGEYREGETVDSTSDNINLDVWESSSSINVDVRDDGSTTSSVSLLGEGDSTMLDGVRVQNTADSGAYNPKMILVEETGNISVSLQGDSVSEVSVPSGDAFSNYDTAYEISGVSATGEPELLSFDELTANNVYVEATGELSGTNEFQFGVVDAQPSIDGENQLNTGVVDSNDNLKGAEYTSAAVTVS